MDHVEITLPFSRTYTLASGSTRRVVERRSVRLRVLTDKDLGKVLRTEAAGTVMLEHDGFSVEYLGPTRRTASLEAFSARMLRLACTDHYRRPRISGEAPPPVRNVVDDGAAQVAQAVAETEARYVVVEGCVAELREALGHVVRVHLRCAPPKSRDHGDAHLMRAEFPWLRFPLLRRADAVAMGAALSEAMEREFPRAVVNAPAPEGTEGVPVVADDGAAARIDARSFASMTPDWADDLVTMAGDAIGRFGTEALIAFARLKEARDHGEDDGALGERMREAVTALAGEPRPYGLDVDHWAMFRTCVLSLAIRLGLEPAPASSPAP